jgi:secondary thiamine-phosphate synthase enzyme
MASIKKLRIATKDKDVVALTKDVTEFVKESGVQSGICVLYIPHTTAALTLTSFMDPAGWEDIQEEICRLIPTRIDFKHKHDTPKDAAGHVKSTLIGASMSLIILDGALLLGHSQGIYFLEFDGPRERDVYVKVLADR